MAENNDNQPTTKADLKELATKADLAAVRSELAGAKTELKGDIAAVRSELADAKTELKGDIAAVKTELKGDISAVRSELADAKTELKGDIKNLSGEILKIHFRMDRMEDTLNTKVAMKTDLNRIFNMLDSISGDIRKYQREDTLRGDAIMRHEKGLSDHENRITLLETKK